MRRCSALRSAGDAVPFADAAREGGGVLAGLAGVSADPAAPEASFRLRMRPRGTIRSTPPRMRCTRSPSSQ